MSQPRIGIYGSVPKNTEIFETITSVLGYDAYRVREVEQDSVVSEVCGRAKTFGCHWTIYDIFTPTDYDAMMRWLRTSMANYFSFKFTFSGFAGYVRGDYQGKSVYSTNQKTVLALDFDTESQVGFAKLHEEIVTGVQRFRQKIEPEFDKELFQGVPELWKLITKYGAPYVLENYEPHLTLASALDGSDKTLNRLVEYLNVNYGDKILNRPVEFDKIYIFEEIVDGKFAGYFRVKDEVSLGQYK
jgi:Protein of unknown function (DUF1045).